MVDRKQPFRPFKQIGSHTNESSRVNCLEEFFSSHSFLPMYSVALLFHGILWETAWNMDEKRKRSNRTNLISVPLGECTVSTAGLLYAEGESLVHAIEPVQYPMHSVVYFKMFANLLIE